MRKPFEVTTLRPDSTRRSAARRRSRSGATGCWPRNITTFAMKFERKLPREIGHEIFICLGFRATQFVIEMDDAEDQSHFFAQIQQQAEKRHRVGASGHGHTDPAACFQESVALAVGLYFLEKIRTYKMLMPTRCLSCTC